jgi:hypothetical protein
MHDMNRRARNMNFSMVIFTILGKKSYFKCHFDPQWKIEVRILCRNPNLAKCGGEAQHLEKLGIWSPSGLPNVQSSTAGPKTPRIGVFLVSLERS